MAAIHQRYKVLYRETHILLDELGVEPLLTPQCHHRVHTHGLSRRTISGRQSNEP
jgi:hypothetical protein